MAGTAERRFTVEEYLEIERAAETKSEFLHGQILAMSGVSRRHDRIAMNLIVQLGTRLRGKPCTPHTADMRVRVNPSAYFYPDASVACGEELYEDSRVDTLTNPVVIFEVLSPSTERFDRGVKFKHYQGVQTITDIVLVSQDEVAVEHYRRGEAGHWDYKLHASLQDELDLSSISCTVPVGDLYEGMSFED
jgi:Uma2 family endonuclease